MSRLMLLPALLLCGTPAGDEGLDLFRTYLKKTFPDKKWQQGPSLLDSPALRTAYPGQRFYFVYSTPPLPPGANLPSVQEAHRRQVEEIRKHYISVTVRVDRTGRVIPLRTPADYNGGLRKVASEDDARTAAAAILSLYGCDQVAPAAVDPKEIVVTRSDKGWSCQSKDSGLFRGTVSFDKEGHCTSISKVYSGPLPP